MRQVTKTSWECTLCGAMVDAPRRPEVWLRAVSGEPTKRLIIHRTAILHSCALAEGSTSS